MTKINYFNGLRILSHNGIFNFVDTVRNIGKSWTFKYRSIKRAFKKGKATYWIRRYKKETRQTMQKFFNAKLLQQLGMTVYDKNSNPNGNLKRQGKRIYVKNRLGQWVIAVEFISLCESADYRSADDCAFDTVVFDEYTTTPTRYAFYRGDEVEDFMDLLVSLKREEKMTVIFLGNKETVYNKYKRFFTILPLPLSFEGIKHYRQHSVIVQQSNIVVNAARAYEEKFRAALHGTRYASYLMEGTTRSAKKIQYSTLNIAYAKLYGQFNYNGEAFAIYIYNYFDDKYNSYISRYIVTTKIDASKTIYTNLNASIYPKQHGLINAHKRELYGVINAVIDNRIYYENDGAHEVSQGFLRWLCNIK